MIQTDKYKKEIIELLKKVGEVNKQLGDYKCHYLTKDAQFFVLLTNGHIEIELDIVKDLAKKNNIAITYTLNKTRYSYTSKSNSFKRKKNINYKWNQLFTGKNSQNA